MPDFFVKLTRRNVEEEVCARSMIAGPFDADYKALTVRDQLMATDDSPLSSYDVVQCPYAVRATDKNGAWEQVAVYETEIEARRHLAVVQRGNPDLSCEVVQI